jgi:hypothetical protein
MYVFVGLLISNLDHVRHLLLAETMHDTAFPHTDADVAVQIGGAGDGLRLLLQRISILKISKHVYFPHSHKRLLIALQPPTQTRMGTAVHTSDN